MKIDKWLEKITMYRLTLYYLIALLTIASGLSLFGLLPFAPLDIILTALLAIIVSTIANFIFSRIFHAITNIESVYITALIIALITPVAWPTNIWFTILACTVAMASKYLLTIDKQHVFNPAAVALAAVSWLVPVYAATWWVGNPYMMPAVVVGGVLLVRRIRRARLVTIFVLVYLATVTAASVWRNGASPTVLTVVQNSLLLSPVWFLGMVMLTEPLTSPAAKKWRSAYAVIAAVLTATPQLRLGFAMTPEMALCVGNIFNYIVSPHFRFILKLQEKLQVAQGTYAFVFDRVSGFKFAPGQYMEWTLPHKNSDSRGNRRYFSLASAPDEDKLIAAVKFYDKPSTYKRALLKMRVGDEIISSQLGGDFVLLRDTKKPLVWIAGGIGVTPFRSMAEHLVRQREQRDVVLLYSNNRIEDIAFAETFETAQPYGVRTVYTLTDAAAVPHDWQGRTGYITAKMIQQEVPDYLSRIFYISGPQLMVQLFEKTLQGLGVTKKNIITDYFPGFSG